jgi:hypothetical protein
MTTALTTLLTCPRDGGANTGTILCSARIVCDGATISSDNGFDAVTDNGTGDFTADFTAAFAAAPFCWAIAEGSGDAYICQLHSQPTTTQVRVLVFNDAGSAADPTAIHVFALGA